MSEPAKPQLDYRIEHWPSKLQQQFWLNVVLKFLPRYFSAIRRHEAQSFLRERRYLNQGYEEVTRRFRVIH